MYQPHRKEVFPDHIKFIKDTIKNRSLMEHKFGSTNLPQFEDFAYIEIDTNNKTWRSTFTFEWLYRNQPPLIDIEEI